MARKLVELGVDILEAGFPIASEGDFEAVDAVGREFPVGAGGGAGALLHAGRGARRRSRWSTPSGRAFTPSSPPAIFISSTSCKKIAAAGAGRSGGRRGTGAALRGRRGVFRRRRRAHRSRYLEQVSRAVVAAGARTVNIPDTVGYSMPEEYGALIGRMARALGDSAVVSVHCHDDLGLAVANSLAAVEAGARQVECTINGIGERAGNCSLEEIVMILKTRADRLPYHTGIHTEQLFPASEMLSSHHHLRAAAEQGHRGPQRLRARSRHPSGRLPEGEDHLRDHRPAQRWACPKAGWCWASTAAATRSTSAAKDLGYELSTAKSWTASTTASPPWPTIARRA